MISPCQHGRLDRGPTRLKVLDTVAVTDKLEVSFKLQHLRPSQIWFNANHSGLSSLMLAHAYLAYTQ